MFRWFFTVVMVVVLLFTINTKSHAADDSKNQINVTFIIPDKEGPLFWQLVKNVSSSVSASIGVNFNYIHTDSDRFAMQSVLEEVVKQPTRPDYLIFRPFKGNTEKTFNFLEKNNIPFVTIEKAFSGDVSQRLGSPQQKYKNWLGQINYDDKSGGELLAKALINEFVERHGDSAHQASIIGIGGDFDSVSLDRQSYLQNLDKLDTEIAKVEQIFPMYWNPYLVKNRLPAIIQRYPYADIYWTAGDQMAFEIVDYFKVTGKPLPIIGGFDWLPETFNKIEKGEMAASVGGHFLIVAQALIKIVDYHRGYNGFVVDNNALFKYELVTKNNVKQLKSFIDSQSWKNIDYSQFLYIDDKVAVKPLTIEALIKITDPQQ